MVYKELRPIFDNKASVYDVIAKLVFQNETGCDPGLERTMEVKMGQFVEEDDEGRYYSTVSMRIGGDTGEFDFSRHDFWHSSLPSKLGWVVWNPVII